MTQIVSRKVTNKDGRFYRWQEQRIHNAICAAHGGQTREITFHPKEYSERILKDS